jgi:hypothetical protein
LPLARPVSFARDRQIPSPSTSSFASFSAANTRRVKSLVDSPSFGRAKTTCGRSSGSTSSSGDIPASSSNLALPPCPSTGWRSVIGQGPSAPLDVSRYCRSVCRYHCPAEVAIRGRFEDRSGKWHIVESCIWHAEPLEEPWGQLKVTRPLRGGRSAESPRNPSLCGSRCGTGYVPRVRRGLEGRASTPTEYCLAGRHESQATCLSKDWRTTDWRNPPRRDPAAHQVAKHDARRTSCTRSGNRAGGVLLVVDDLHGCRQ